MTSVCGAMHRRLHAWSTASSTASVSHPVSCPPSTAALLQPWHVSVRAPFLVSDRLNGARSQGTACICPALARVCRRTALALLPCVTADPRQGPAGPACKGPSSRPAKLLSVALSRIRASPAAGPGPVCPLPPPSPTLDALAPAPSLVSHAGRRHLPPQRLAAYGPRPLPPPGTLPPSPPPPPTLFSRLTLPGGPWRALTEPLADPAETATGRSRLRHGWSP